MSFENVLDINSEEFEKILKEHGWAKKEDACCNGACKRESKEEKKSMKNKLTLKNVVDTIDEWSMTHPGLSLVIFLGGSSFLAYKLGQSFIAGAVHKGNLKTIHHLDKIGR